jgi:hypothetical protein
MGGGCSGDKSLKEYGMWRQFVEIMQAILYNALPLTGFECHLYGSCVYIMQTYLTFAHIRKHRSRQPTTPPPPVPLPQVKMEHKME